MPLKYTQKNKSLHLFHPNSRFFLAIEVRATRPTQTFKTASTSTEDCWAASIHQYHLATAREGDGALTRRVAAQLNNV